MVFDNSNLCDLRMEETDESFRITYYTLYMERLGGHNPYLLRYGLELLNFQSCMGKIKKWRQQQQPDCTPLGWDTDNSPEACCKMKAEVATWQSLAEWDSLRAQRTLHRHSIKDEAAVRQNIINLKEMARICKEHGIRFTILCTPVRPDYAAGVPLRQQRLIHQAHEYCCQHYGATSLDLSEDSTFTKEEYFDPDHLTHDGAAHLTRILQESL